ncbi:MAG: hypothetical protein ACE5O2_01585 [Armatimonadota bacterium]
MNESPRADEDLWTGDGYDDKDVAPTVVLGASPAAAGRFIAIPYAETLPGGRITLWQFVMFEARTTDDLRLLNRLDAGLTDELELGVFFIDPPGRAPTDTWLNLQFRVARETECRPTVSVGVWDLTDRDSWFVAFGKTLDISSGSSDGRYLKVGLALGGDRLNGLFAGIDLRFERDTGVFVEYTPESLRLPKTDGADIGVYHWISPQWRVRGTWAGGNPMLDVLWAGWMWK